MIKHVTSPEMFRLEQSLDCVGLLLSKVFECVPGLRDLNRLDNNAELESQTLRCCCLSLSKKERTAWTWVHLVGVMPNAFQEIS